MKYRKWFVRLFVLGLIACGGAGYYLYERWTNPEAVRAAVLTELGKRFPGAVVHLDSARLRLLGGVQLRELRLTRQDDPGAEPLTHIPSAVVFHDKQQLAQGKLVIRKIKLEEPKLCIIRRADGMWNLAGLVAPPRPGELIPLIEAQDGTVTLHDQQVSATPIEIRDVSLTVVPSGNSIARIQASGTCDLLGKLDIQGTANLETGELMLRANVPQVQVGEPLLARLTSYCSQLREHAAGIAGIASLEADLIYHPTSPRPWSYKLHVSLRDGRIRHNALPFPVECAKGVAHYDGARLILERLEGQMAGAAVSAFAELQSLTPESDLHAQVKVEKLKLGRELYDKLPPHLQQLCKDFSPEGPLMLACEFRRKNGQMHIRHTLRPEGLAIRYHDFAYPVEALTGTLVQDIDENEKSSVLTVNLTGLAGGQAVRVNGKVTGEGPTAGIELDLSGENVLIDESLLAALPAQSRQVARRFWTPPVKPAGQIDFHAEIRRKYGATEFQDRYVLKFHHANVCFDDFRYPLEQVEGTLELLPDSWRFYEAKGKHKGGEFQGGGYSQVTPDGTQTTIVIRATNALLDEEMKAALKPGMKKAWDLFEPRGRADFVARLDSVNDREPALDLRLTARGCDIKPACFRYALSDVAGTFHYLNQRVTLEKFQARHGKTAISLEGGDLVLRPNGGYWAELRQLKAEPLTVDEEFLNALPEQARVVFQMVSPDRPIRIATKLTLDDPQERGQLPGCWWDGYVALDRGKVHCGIDLNDVTGYVACRGSYDGTELKAVGHIHMDRVTVFRQPLRNFHTDLKLTSDALVFPGMKAQLYGGEVYAHKPLRIDFDPPIPPFGRGGQRGVRYEVGLTGSQLDLEKFAGTLGRSGKVRGKASAQIELSGKGDLSTLQGKGKVDVPEGHLYDLPLVLDLLTFLSGKLPNGTAFEEAHAQFSINGERLQVSQLDLLGDATTLRGQGSMKIDGSGMNLEMHGLLWGRGLPLLPPLVDKIPPAISKQLMKIRIRGDLSKKVDIQTEPFPLVVEPVKELMQLMGTREKTRRMMPGPRLDGNR